MDIVSIEITTFALVTMLALSRTGFSQRRQLTKAGAENNDTSYIRVLPGTKFPTALAAAIFGIACTTFSLVVQLTVGFHS